VLAAVHPEDIAGLVLEDAVPPGFIDRFLELAPAGSDEAGLAAGIPNPEDFDMITSFRQIETPTLPDSVPVVVLTHGEGHPPPCFACSPEFPIAEYEHWWQEAQVELADALHGELVAVEGASHFIGDDRPDVVVAAVQRVVEAVRDPSSWATPVS
jgi:pimeloyl-ACP methyl ester carboxylesterase